jgi:hypothetical protein
MSGHPELRPNNRRKEGCDFLEQIQLAHLVRVGVSWKTADSSRVSGLIAEQSLSRSLPYQILPERVEEEHRFWKRISTNAGKNFDGDVRESKNMSNWRNARTIKEQKDRVEMKEKNLPWCGGGWAERRAVQRTRELAFILEKKTVAKVGEDFKALLQSYKLEIINTKISYTVLNRFHVWKKLL